MQKYRKIEEYMQINYKTMISELLEEYIKNKMLNNYDKYKIVEITVNKVDYTKSRINIVEFTLYFSSIIALYKDNKEEISDYNFNVRMIGTFKNGFKTCPKTVEKECEEEVFSDSLVPIISKNEMDNYASKFLKVYCPNALIVPTRLNVNDIVTVEHIKVYCAPLSSNIHGKIYFASDKVTVYDEDNNVCEREVNPGTILINFDLYKERGVGFIRNTIIHELVHWFFHRNFFELKHLLNNDATCEVYYNNDDKIAKDIEWMEWQARQLAPKILMPKKMALKKYQELWSEINNSSNNSLTRAEKGEFVLAKFSDYFGTSKLSSKIRLKELGINEVEGLCNYIDGKYILPFFCKENILKSNQTFIISVNEFTMLIKNNESLRKAFNNETLLFFNNMIVVNLSKYFDYDNFKMTEYGLNHVDECCLIFEISKEYLKERNKILYSNLFFYMQPKNSQDIEVNSEQLSLIMKNTIENVNHFNNKKEELPLSFKDTLNYHINKAFAKKIIFSFNDLAIETDISVKTLKSYREGKTIPKRVNVLKFGFGLCLSAPYIIDLLKKADCELNLNNEDNCIFYTMIYAFSRVGLEQLYLYLKQVGKEGLLKLSNTYLKSHNLQ